MGSSVFDKAKKRLPKNVTFMILILLAVSFVTIILLVLYWYKFDKLPWQGVRVSQTEAEGETLSVGSAVESITEEETAASTSSMSVNIVEDMNEVFREVSILGTIESVDVGAGSLTVVPSSSDESFGEDKIEIYVSDETEIYIRDLTETEGVEVVPGGFITDGESGPPPLEEDDKMSLDQLSAGDEVMVDIILNEADEAHADKIEVIKQ